MKITFIRPALNDQGSTDAFEPLVFALLSGLTPKDIELELFDDRIEKLPELFETDLVAITVETFTAERNYL